MIHSTKNIKMFQVKLQTIFQPMKNLEDEKKKVPIAYKKRQTLMWGRPWL